MLQRLDAELGSKDMDIYNKVREGFKRDDAVSPVIAVILMVAITVVLAATVYVWVSGFASQDSGPEQASATARGFEVGGNDVNWIRVTLTKGSNAPYAEDDVNYTLLAPDGSSHNGDQSGDDYLCTNAVDSSPDDGICDEDFHDNDEDAESQTWDVGETLYMPCQASGDHSVTISIKGTTILDAAVDCDAGA